MKLDSIQRKGFITLSFRNRQPSLQIPDYTYIW